MGAAAGLADTALRMRRRVAEGRYAEAQRELQEYCRCLSQIVPTLPAGAPELAQMAAEWRRLVHDLRRLVLEGRAHAAARLARLPRSGPYATAPGARNTWECQG